MRNITLLRVFALHLLFLALKRVRDANPFQLAPELTG